jgi:DNA-binding NtrC family response regulator
MNRPRIHFIDDDPTAGRLFSRFAVDAGYEVTTFKDPVAALEAFRQSPADAVITDLKMPGMSGIELLAELKTLEPRLPVIIITGYSTVENAIEALRLGAADFVKKPYDAEELLHQVGLVLEAANLKRENQALRQALARERQSSSILGESAPVAQLRELIAKLAQLRCNVIVTGESGTGKELVARDLHQLSPWAEQPFVVIDCGAVSDTLLESELFGHEKGAFTGADQQRIGRLESATGGTVFLDEICNVSDAMQTKLLRVVQEQKITRVGGVEQIDIDVRFVAATNRDLAAMVKAGDFREDLYHRLNVVRIDVPPLRERTGDVGLLIHHFIHEFNLRYQRDVQGFDPASMQQLEAYGWPGNVRELRNLVERHLVLADGHEMSVDQSVAESAAVEVSRGIDHDQPDLKTLEQRYIEKTLQRCDGNRELTARILGINKSTLWRKMQQYER